MSASDKKKLRKEQREAALTEKQQKALKEAKQLKRMTTAFVSILVVIAIAFCAFMIGRYIIRNGVLEKRTIAATVDGTDLNTIEFTYYYSDAINDYYQNAYNTYGTNTEIMLLYYSGLDIAKPLNEQTNPETGKSWAEYFIDVALSNAQSDYALYNKAMADADFDCDSDEINSVVDTEASYLTWNAYFAGSMDAYMRAAYCNGATEEGYLEYVRKNAIAAAYYNDHKDNLSYTAEQVDTYTADRYNEFSSFNYNYYTISYSSYLNKEEGTTNEDGTITYTEEQKNAAREAARADAEALMNCNSVEALNLAIASLSFNKDLTTPATSTASTDILYSTLKEEYAEWLADAERKEFDVKAFPVENTTTVDGKEVTTVDSYNIVMYRSTNENLKKHGNVRHVLVQFEQSLGESGNYTVTDEAKTAAKEEADKLYADWKEAGATKEGFIQMVKDRSDDPGKTTNEGLYEDIHPSSEYLAEFRDWAVDPARIEGDHGIVQTSEGYHIMYFEGYSDETYRDYLVNTSMINEDMTEWYEGILETATATLKDTSRLDTAMVISG